MPDSLRQPILPPAPDDNELPAVLAPPPPTARAPRVMEQIIVQRLTRNVRSIRQLLCLSQAEAAERLGRDISLWQAFESPDLQLSAITVATLVKVACVLRVGLSDLLADPEERRT